MLKHCEHRTLLQKNMNNFSIQCLLPFSYFICTLNTELIHPYLIKRMNEAKGDSSNSVQCTFIRSSFVNCFRCVFYLCFYFWFTALFCCNQYMFQDFLSETSSSNSQNNYVAHVGKWKTCDALCIIFSHCCWGFDADEWSLRNMLHFAL